MKKANHRSDDGEGPHRGHNLILSYHKLSNVLRQLIFFIVCIQFAACASVYVLSETDRRAVTAGEKTVILLRVQCEIDNTAREPFGTSAWIGEPYVVLGLGSFDTIGEPRQVTHYFLSEELRRIGWTYFVLSPGIYYLAAVGPRSDAQHQSIRDAPRWRINVPENTGLIYAGTLHLSGRTDGSFLLGGKVVKPSDGREFVVKDESDLAREILAGHFAQSGDVRTILMQRWKSGEPIIIRSPRTDLRR